jgi:site-specific DNA recombinase
MTSEPSPCLARVLYTLRKQDNLLTEFDEKLWSRLVDYATVYDKDNVRFIFKDGTVIQA